ncbi:hypothetical protein ABL78_0430 [Leptomonas seymouri]|uniref:FHA domain-containing protein n=1 Tax=Leptomonas seymouri TaxID=5684 RepID=A0A0N1IMR5_LEPSE|nr:hypothetical protein ABL78_0430 [Leptomonas seymouri]|eukprot:KPI90500.1 hypothetical protein ABL78_0430 [Leptomonas seymouri]
MRYYVEACFNTDATGLILSPSPGEDNAFLVADNCCMELRLHTPNADASNSTSAVPILEALPWDSFQLRLCVNGVSYGTGPLMLRDRDILTLQARTSPASNPPQMYIYSISALPAASSSSSRAAEGDDDQHHSTSLTDEDQRPYAAAANMAEYAKWNNFYGYRFGNSAGCVVSLHRCACGCYLPRRGGAATSGSTRSFSLSEVDPSGRPVRFVAAAATGTQEIPRTLVTLLPSIPALLETEEEAAQRGAAAPPAIVSCCACAFLHSGTGQGAAGHLRSGSEEPAVSALTDGKSKGAAGKRINPAEEPPHRPGGAALSSADTSPWEAYFKARQMDWRAADLTSTSNGPNDNRTHSKAPLDQTSAGLLLRIASLESALMGCRYE